MLPKSHSAFKFETNGPSENLNDNLTEIQKRQRKIPKQ